MSRPFTPKVVTANHLIEGDVIYLTAADTWTRDHAEAALLTDESSAAAKLALGETQPAVAVGVMLADARMGKNGPEPVHFREVFRAIGPSNYFHGKQAGTPPAAGA